jgi:non-ribosomal peptide synthetase component E (peptide arylation enzyme)
MAATRAKFALDGVIYRSAAEADRYYRCGAWLRSPAGDALRAAALRAPDNPYILSADGDMTFAECDRRTEILAASLAQLGLRRGDRALFQMGTVPETIVALFGCYKAGVLPVCTLPQYREIEIGQLAELSKARAYFVQADFNPKFDQVRFARQMADRHPSIEFIIAARDRASSGVLDLEQLCSAIALDTAREQVASWAIDAEDVLTFQLSGGSTGVPKIIPRMHGEYLGQAHSWARRHKYRPSDALIWPLPLIHNAAMLLIVIPAVLETATIVLQDRFEPEVFLSAIEKFKVTYAGSIGPVAPRLLDYPDLARHDLSSLRLFIALDRADAIEPHMGVRTTNLFGITEGLLMTSAPDDPPAARFKTVGRPTCELDEVRVLSPASEDPVPIGVEGELCFRGPYSLRGYYNAPEITAASFTKDGFFRSGDIVREMRIDRRSYFVFLGRIKDNISRGNEKFAAEEVENLIVRHPAIVDAKVVAMPDRYLGEKACAFIIPRPGRHHPAVAELAAFLVGEGLAKYKLPERIEVIDAFPVTRVGKIDKKAMREIIAQKLQDEAVHGGADRRHSGQ